MGASNGCIVRKFYDHLMAGDVAIGSDTFRACGVDISAMTAGSFKVISAVGDSGGEALITTSAVHGLTAGQWVAIVGVDDGSSGATTIDGFYRIGSTPTTSQMVLEG